MKLSPRTLKAGRWIFSGLTDRGDVAACRRCGNQVIFDEHLVSPGYAAYCAWHDEDLYWIEIEKHYFSSWIKLSRLFAAKLDFFDKVAIMIMRLKKG